jgi:phosphoglycolate phosphatase-like HAD superfamily hydrolase
MSRDHPTQAVVFDLDGTLLDSLPLVLRAFSHALSPFGGQPTMDMFATLGGPPEKVFPSLIADASHVPAAMRRLHEFNRENHHLIVPFTGATALLGELRARGVATAIWTGRDRFSTEHLLELHGLHDLVATVVCGDDLPTHKPDSAGMTEILRRLQRQPHEVLYVGDADVDVLGGTGAGVDTILIGRARILSEEVSQRAWRTVESPFEAYEWILRCTAT